MYESFEADFQRVTKNIKILFAGLKIYSKLCNTKQKGRSKSDNAYEQDKSLEIASTKQGKAGASRE